MSAVPTANTLLGVGSTPFLRTRLNASPLFSCVSGVAKPAASDRLRCGFAKLVTLTLWLPALAVAVAVTPMAVAWLTLGTTALKALWSLMFENAVFKSFKTNLMAA